MTQYGVLKNVTINGQGCFEDLVKTSDETLDTLGIGEGYFISFKIGVKPDAKNLGGMNLFGEKFGDYTQGIIMSVRMDHSGAEEDGNSVVADIAGNAAPTDEMTALVNDTLEDGYLLYYLVGNWNSWFNAMVLLKDRSRYPLQLLLKEILVTNDSSTATVGSAGGISINSVQGATAYRELVKYCVIVVATAPILAIYPFLQKYFVKGVFVGSIKG